MASKTQVILIDDLDGGEATETVEFGIDEVVYEIDLSDENAEALREAITKWTGVARRVRGSGGSPRSSVYRPPARSGSNGELSKPERNKLRAWAAENGYTVAERGRISMEVQQAWIAAGRP
jgi:hypothetical protein